LNEVDADNNKDRSITNHNHVDDEEEYVAISARKICGSNNNERSTKYNDKTTFSVDGCNVEDEEIANSPSSASNNFYNNVKQAPTSSSSSSCWQQLIKKEFY